MSKLSDLSDCLGVPNICQDWGICAGDANRLEEFLGFIEQNQALLNDPLLGPELFDLVFSSMCPLHEGNPEEKVLQRFLPLLQLLADRFTSRWTYWQEFWDRLEEEDGQPVEVLHRLRSLLDHAKP